MEIWFYVWKKTSKDATICLCDHAIEYCSSEISNGLSKTVQNNHLLHYLSIHIVWMSNLKHVCLWGYTGVLTIDHMRNRTQKWKDEDVGYNA